MRRAGRRDRGQTLFELLVVLAVVAVLASQALPAGAELLRDARQRERVTAFVVSAQLARSEALRRGHSVTLCPSDDGETCGEDLAAGWIVFDDRGGDRERDRQDALLDHYEAPRAGRIRTTVLRFTWRPAGRRATNGTVTFCAEPPSQRSRAVVVSYTGRPRVADRLPGGKRLPC
jgi:type IV fimbrial biogenesis protein FimT